MEKKRKIFYVFDKKVLHLSRNIPNLDERALIVQSLISSFGLLQKCELVDVEPATHEDLLSFHSPDYLRYLEEVQNSQDLEIHESSEDVEKFNLGYDCPLFENIYDFAKVIAGSSLTAAKTLVSCVKNSDDHVVAEETNAYSYGVKSKSYLRFRYVNCVTSTGADVFDPPEDVSFDENQTFIEITTNPKKRYNQLKKNDTYAFENNIHPIAINWFGGWHHAQRDAAEGFCYVNDIVIAIQFLLKTFKRVLYVDLDVHHGNGVENAFLFSSRVFVFSLHKFESGFYPASGSLDDIGLGNGRYHTVNVPLKDGITDEMYERIFKKLWNKIVSKFKPDCMVIQCGADTIAGDPLGGFNLTQKSIGNCLRLMLTEKLSTLILGGGGYNSANVARCWAYLTSIALGCSLPNDIPDNPYFHFFGPTFELELTPNLRRNENTEEYIKHVTDKIMQNLDSISDQTPDV